MKKPLIAVIVLAVIGAVVWRSGAFRKPVGDGIRLSGNIEITEVEISFKVPGRLVELNVKEGAPVRKGDIIARIDAQSTLRQRDREQAGLAGSTAMLAQMRTAIEWNRATIDGDIALRTAEIRAAEAQLNDLLAGSRTQEVQTAEAQLADARTWHDQARRDWDRAQTLYKNEDISTAQYEQYRSRFESTAQAQRQAAERLALVREGPRRQTIEAARAQLARAQAALRLAEANRIELRRKEQELAVRHADIRRAEAGVAIVQAQLEDTAVESPIDGVVLVKSAEQGEVIPGGATVATIGDIAHPWLRAYVSESDLGRVRLGQKVKLTTDSFPGKEYWGAISFISADAEFTPKQIQTQDERVKLVYRIKVEVANPNQELKANMPVDAEIVP